MGGDLQCKHILTDRTYFSALEDRTTPIIIAKTISEIITSNYTTIITIQTPSKVPNVHLII
jgi:hypothetical protein